MRIAMIGITGAGKTAFLAGLYERLGVREAHGYNMRPSASDFYDSLIQIGHWQEISFRRNGGLDFPDITQRTTAWSFELCNQAEHICDIECIDYRGGLLSEITPGELDMERRNQILRIAHFIQDCEILVLFIDAIRLLYGQLPEETTGIDRMYQILDALDSNFPGKELTVLIALTKVDGVDQSRKNNLYSKLYQDCLDEIDNIHGLIQRNQNWRGAMIPVSAVGEAASIELLQDDPWEINTTVNEPLEPINVEHAIFYCASHGLDSDVSNLRPRIVQNYEEADQMQASIDETQESIEEINQQLTETQERIIELEVQINNRPGPPERDPPACPVLALIYWLLIGMHILLARIYQFVTRIFTPPDQGPDPEDEIRQRRREENLLRADLASLERELRTQQASQRAIRGRQPLTEVAIPNQENFALQLRRIVGNRIFVL